MGQSQQQAGICRILELQNAVSSRGKTTQVKKAKAQ